MEEEEFISEQDDYEEEGISLFGSADPLENELLRIILEKSAEASQLQQESSISPLEQLKYEDRDWLKLLDPIFLQESTLDEKYYKSLTELSEDVIKGDEDETFQRLGELELADDKSIGIIPQCNDANQMLIERYIHEISLACNTQSSMAHLIERRKKVLQRIHLALSRERERRIPRARAPSAPLSQEVSKKKAPLSFLEKTLSSKTTFIDTIKKFLSSAPANWLPLTLLDESTETVEKFQKKVHSFLKGKSTTEEHRLQALTSLIVLGLAKGSIPSLLFSVNCVLEEIDRQENEKIQERLPVSSYLKRLEKYRYSNALLVHFRKYTEISALTPEVYLGSWKCHWNPKGKWKTASQQRLRSFGSTSSTDCFTTNGAYHFIHNEKGLVKIGTGLQGTIRGHVYHSIAGFHSKDKSTELACVRDKLVFMSSSLPIGVVIILNANTLIEEEEISLSKIRDEDPKIVAIQSTIKSTNTRLRLTSDGSYLYAICEVTENSPEGNMKTYCVDVFDLISEGNKTTVNFVRRVGLKPFDSSTVKGHEGISCNGCHRMNFRLKRHRCTVCSNINLCHTCMSSGIVGNNTASAAHQRDHKMELIEPPKEPPALTSEQGKEQKTKPLPIPPLNSDSFSRSGFYTTGTQLGILIPPRLQPNRLDKYLCRMFDLTEGTHIYDMNTEYYNVGTCPAYDRKNNLIWCLSSELQTITRWRNVGPPALGYPSSVSLCDQTFSPENLLANPKYSLTSGATGIGLETSVIHIMANLDIFSRRALPVADDDDMNQMLNIYKKGHFTIDASKRIFDQILSLIEWGKRHYLSECGNAAADSSLSIYMIISGLRLLKSNLDYLLSQPSKEKRNSILNSQDGIIQKLYSLIVSLVQIPLEEGEISSIRSESIDVLITNLKAFFSTPESQAKFLMDLLQGKDDVLNDSVSASMRNHFIESTTLQIAQDISYQHALSSQGGETTEFIPILIRESIAPFLNYLEQLPGSVEVPAELHHLQPSLRLLIALQLNLFSYSPSDEMKKIFLFWLDHIVAASLKLIEQVFQVFHKLKCQDEAEQRKAFNGLHLDKLLENSILGNLLISLLSNLHLLTDSPSSIDAKILPSLKRLLSEADRLNQLFATSETAEIKYLRNNTPVYECLGKVAESAHPYPEYTDRDVNVQIPGALALYVYFDGRCCTESEYDYIELCKARNVPITRRYFGPSSNWPATPILIPGDSVIIHLHSEGQASRNNRWGFKILLKGIISTYNVGLPWHMDLEKTCASLAAQCSGNLIVGKDVGPEEEKCFKFPLMAAGINDHYLAGSSAMDTRGSTGKLETFMDDLIRGEGQAAKLNDLVCGELETKRRILGVADGAKEIVNRTCRALIAAIVKHSGKAQDVVTCTENLPASLGELPQFVTEVWNSVYVSQGRPWIRMQVQEMQKESEKEIDPVQAYELVCEKILDTVSFVLKLDPVQPPLPISDILSFIKERIPSSTLLEAAKERKERAQSRVTGLKALTETLNCVTFTCVRQDVLARLGSDLRKGKEAHFLLDIKGCQKELTESVTSAYQSTVDALLLLLNSPASDIRLQLLVLNSLALEYREKDHTLLSESGIIPVLQSLASGEGKLWRLSNRPTTTLPIQMEECQQLISSCTRIGKHVGPVIPAQQKQEGNSFSFSLWLYPMDRDSGSVPWKTVLFKGVERKHKKRSPALFFNTEDRSLAFCVSTIGTWNVSLRSNSEIPFEQWTHIACVCAGMEMTLYLNGIKDASLTLTENVVWNKHPFYLGKTPPEVNDKPGVNGFIESASFFYNKAISEEMITKLSSSEPLPPENDTKDLGDKRRLQSLSHALYTLLVITSMEWTSTNSSSIAFQDNLLADLFSQFSSKMEKFISKSAALVKSPEIARKKHKPNNDVTPEDTPLMWHQDSQCFELLILLFRLSETPPGRRFFSQPKSVYSLFPFLAHGTPHIQRLLARLLRQILPRISPSDFARESASPIDLLFDIIGQFLAPTENKIRPALERSTDNVPMEDESSADSWMVVVYKWSGMSSHDFTRLIAKQLGKDANAAALAEGIGTEAQELGRAVVKTGTKGDCLQLVTKMSKAGFTAKMIEGSTASHRTSNSQLDSSNPHFWNSGQSAFSLAAESVMLLRILWKDSKWHSTIHSQLVNHVKSIPAVISKSSASLHEMRVVLASLSVVNGFTDGLRPGAKVKVIQQDESKVGSLINYDRMTGTASVAYEDEPKKIVSVAPGQVNTVSEIEIESSDFPLLPELLPSFTAFLQNGHHALSVEKPLLFSRLKASAMKTFSWMMESPQSVKCFLNNMESLKLPSLIDIAASFGRLDAQSLSGLLVKERRILQRLYEITSNVEELFIEEEMEVIEEVKTKNYSELLPHSPLKHVSAELPTEFNLKAKDVHHTLIHNERCVEFYGTDADELFLLGDVEIPEGIPEFYFEVKVDTLKALEIAARRDSKAPTDETPSPTTPSPSSSPSPSPSPSRKFPCNFSIGLCPTSGLPLWSNGCYGYHARGQKSQVQNKELFLSLPRFNCPFCGMEEITERELTIHIAKRHGNSTRQVVCPICASSPFGNPQYISQDFHGHMKDRHRNRLPADPCPPIFEKYGDSFGSGDIVGCGWNQEEGTVYFTLNGKYVGVAFVGVKGSFFPLVSVRTHASRVAINFGQEPFAFDINDEQNITYIRTEERIIKEQMQQELEARLLQEREDRASQVNARKAQAELLQAFVGFHVKFCMLALEKTNDNVEMAAEWAMTHFDQYSNEQPQLFIDDDEEEMKEEESEENPKEEMEDREEEDRILFNVGYTYSLTKYDSKENRKQTSKRANVDNLKLGAQVAVSEALTSKGPNWVDSMEKTVGRLGVVKAIDSLSMTALLHFYYDGSQMWEEWWFPVRSLEILPKERADPHPELQGMNSMRIEELTLETEERIAQLFICRAALALISPDQQVSLQTLGGISSLQNLFQLVAGEYLSAPLPDLSMSPCKNPFLENLRKLLRDICASSTDASPSPAETILQESFRLLSVSSSFISSSTTIEESKHPYPHFAKDLTKKIHVPDSNALFITFDRKCRIAPRDSLAFYADEDCTTLYTSIDDSAEFVPLVLPAAQCWLRFTGHKEKSESLWGYRFTVTPTQPAFNMGMWILNFLLHEGVTWVKNIHPRAFRTLFHYLYTSNLPVDLKVIVVRMLTRILQVSGLPPDDIRSSDPRKMRNTMQQEIEELLSVTPRSELPSPYLQSLTELMIEVRRSSLRNQMDVEVTGGYPKLTLFDSMIELSQLLHAFATREKYPPRFLFQAWKNLNRKADESVYLKLTQNKISLSRTQSAWEDIFHQFDEDADSLLNLEEFNVYRLSCVCEPFEEEQWKNFLENYNCSEGLSLDGFLKYQQREMTMDPSAVAKQLCLLGYDAEFKRCPVNEFPDLASVTQSQTSWTIEMDEQLVALVHLFWDRTGIEAHTISPNLFRVTPTDLETFPKLAKISSQDLRLRFSVLQLFNSFVAKALPLIDLTLAFRHPNSLGHQLVALRYLIFFDTKVTFLTEVLNHSATEVEPPVIYLDRLDALKEAEEDQPNPHCVFFQAQQQLHSLNPLLLRQKERAFSVIFKGENAEGFVGPYRESISQLCMELQSSAVGTLIPCPNQQLAKETIGVGENREKFILNPSATSRDNLQAFQFIGKLMGVAIRSKNPLSLDLPSFVWKPIVGLKVDRRDLKEIDYSETESWERIEKMSPEEFSASIFETFTTMLSDRKQFVDLVPNGSEIPVTYENRKEFIEMKWDRRLKESKAQMRALLKGLRTIVPLPLLYLFTWRDVRYLICGNPEIDLELLKKHTQYRGGVKPTDPHIVNFWKVLEEFTPAERTHFLRFVWGRERLPPESEFREEMKIFPNTKGDPDRQLPHADTCFFNVTLPVYSTEELMRKNLLIAITNTMSMDGDTQDEGGSAFGVNQNPGFNPRTGFVEDDDDY